MMASLMARSCIQRLPDTTAAPSTGDSEQQSNACHHQLVAVGDKTELKRGPDECLSYTTQLPARRRSAVVGVEGSLAGTGMDQGRHAAVYCMCTQQLPPPGLVAFSLRSLRSHPWSTVRPSAASIWGPRHLTLRRLGQQDEPQWERRRRHDEGPRWMG